MCCQHASHTARFAKSKGRSAEPTSDSTRSDRVQPRIGARAECLVGERGGVLANDRKPVRSRRKRAHLQPSTAGVGWTVDRLFSWRRMTVSRSAPEQPDQIAGTLTTEYNVRNVAEGAHA